jgi:NitT/TauT family transport system substrate-binding protein
MTNRLIRPALTRRKLLQVTAGGVVISGLGLPARAAPYDGPFTWISPRGTLEVLDDYGFWIARKMGYFDGLDVEMQPGPSDGTATVKFVDVGQADMGFPSPGVFSFAIENGMALKSVFHMGALDTFSLAFRKGEGPSDIKGIEGKTILLGSAAWQPIVDPMLAAQGVDISTITYVEAGWPTWGTALAAGQGDAALAWEGLRAEWISTGLEFEYWLGVQNSPCPPTPSWSGRPISRIPTRWPSSSSTCAAGPRGSNSQSTTRARRCRRCSRSSRRWPEPRAGAWPHVDHPADERLPRAT